MSKLLSKLVRKVPPFRYIHIRLNELQQESDKIYSDLKREYAELEKNYQQLSDVAEKQRRQIASLKKKQEQDNTRLKDKLTRTERKLTSDIEYHYYKGLHPDQYEENLKEWYYNRTGKELDLKRPQTYNEKIQWMKLYDSTPLKTRLADKYLVKDWVAEKIGEEYLIPLLGVYDRFDDIDFDALPEKFVIKTNHAWATNRVVTDKETFSRKEAKAFFDRKMKMNFAFWNGLELQYKEIPPKIIIEEYIESDKDILDDYKVFCFSGKAYCIEYMTGRGKCLRRAVYDREWNLAPYSRKGDQCEEPVEKPQNLEKMLSLAETLGKEFSHVRVDFYILDNGEIKFGEMTFTPASGGVEWTPAEYNRILGDCIKLPTDIPADSSVERECQAAAAYMS